jgi:CxxC motif-containing protein (DUF1111 family)
MDLKTLPALVLAGLAGLAAITPVLADAPEARTDPKVARGKYLVSIMGCHDCHTPWKMGAKGAEPDMSRALSGIRRSW